MGGEEAQTINDLMMSNMRLMEERDRWRNICLSIIDTVKHENMLPRGSNDIVSKHRREWPALWQQIDKIIETH